MTEIERKTKYNPVPIETKQSILEDAKPRILQGETLEDIAASHGVSKRTLNSWLMSLGEEYQELRQAWIDGMLSQAKDAIDGADEQLPLARAREQWKAATWYAERRDRARYGVQVANINIINGVTMDVALANEAGALLEHLSDK